MEVTEKNEVLAAILLKVIDENQQVEESSESEEWILGYHEACNMVIRFLEELKK